MRIAYGGLVLFTLTLAACSRSVNAEQEQGVIGGDAKVGQHLTYAYGCGTCHIIPGIAQAIGTVGPPLQRFGSRIYIAGLLVNTPDNLVRWISHPQEIDPGNAMPDLGVTEQQARDIGAYLYTLR